MPAAEAPIAGDHPFGAETLQWLARVDTKGSQVLSFYIDLDPERFPTPDTRRSELGSLLDEARREGGDKEADRVKAWLEAHEAISRGAGGVAIFSSAPADIFEAVHLPAPVEPLAVVDLVPWLEPIAAMITPGDWGVAVVSRRSARLFRGGPGGLTEFATIDDEVHRRHAQGGWSQANYERGIEEQVAAHTRRVADRLLRAHQRRPFAHLVIVCSGELRPVVEHSLHSELAETLAGTVSADLEHARVDEIAATIAPVIERIERDRERELVARLEQGLGTGGRAAAGLDDVLAALEERRVDTLLVAERAELSAERCPTCGRLWTTGTGTCPLDGHALEGVDATEHAIEETMRQSGEVVVARYESEWLNAHGGIACLLRW